MYGLDAGMAYPLQEKFSMAVLPFNNLSGDPGQEYFSDGFTEQIIASFSRTLRMFVIIRNSTFAYKGKPVKVQKIAEDFLLRISLKNSASSSLGRIIFKYLKTLVPDHL
jgi:TolB-like protein